MATLVIKNFPDELHAKLKARAQAHHRSLAKEALTLLEQGANSLDAKGQHPPIEPFRLKGKPLTIEDIEAAIAEGRKKS